MSCIFAAAREMSEAETISALEEVLSPEGIHHSDGNFVRQYLVVYVLCNRLQEIRIARWLKGMGFFPHVPVKTTVSELAVQPMQPPRGLIFAPRMDLPQVNKMFWPDENLSPRTPQ